ncbi:hypothetical protein [Haladaptatus sp. ZSTT2]|uniref:hypothetical protein n=1 Tax=Haladaptatus sp. ZSTT2 TaxID=3120515 RepID=UPI00300EF61A
MAQPDDRILEFLEASGAHRARTLRTELAETGGDLNYPLDYLEQRLELLWRAGLLEYDGFDAAYALTDLGADYLSGRLDASDLTLTDPGTESNTVDRV